MPAATIDEKFRALTDAICYWLGYNYHIGRNAFIHEASLRYPIADCLTSKWASIKDLQLEYYHPVFPPKKIDLVVFNPNASPPTDETDDSGICEVYEFKLAKYTTGIAFGIEHQRIFNDLARLALHNRWNKKSCFFLMCGKMDEFKSYFVSQDKKPLSNTSKTTIKTSKLRKLPQDWAPSGIYSKWFGFSIGQKIRKCIDDRNKDWGFSTFKRQYRSSKSSHMHLHRFMIQTTCMSITPASTDKTHACGIWKVEGLPMPVRPGRMAWRNHSRIRVRPV